MIERMYQCRCGGGCPAEGVIIPQLVVPCNAKARVQVMPWAVGMGMPVCVNHFKQLTTRTFLAEKAITEDIAKDFIKANSIPNFEAATLEPIVKGSDDWNKWVLIHAAEHESRN